MANETEYYYDLTPDVEDINNVLIDLVDILNKNSDKSVVIRVQGDDRNHFDLGEGGKGGLSTKPTYYRRTFASDVNAPDGTGRYIEIETQSNPVSGSWTNPRYPGLKMNDPIYIGTAVTQQKNGIETVDVPGQNYLMISDESKTEISDGAEVKIKGKAQIIIGDTDPNYTKSTGIKWNPIAPGKTYEGTIYGPVLRLHGTSCIDLDDGYFRKTPTMHLHGGMYIDISDGSTYEGKYSNTESRHKDAGLSSPPWGEGNGPWLHMHDNASLVMDAGSLICAHESGALFVQGNSWVQFDKELNMVLAGGEFKSSGSPIFSLSDTAEFRVMNSGSFIMESSVQIHYGGKGKHDFINDGYVHITNSSDYKDEYCGNYNPKIDSDKLFIDIHAAPNIQIGGLTQIQHHGYAAHMMMGRTYFNMESQVDTSNHTKDDQFGPLLACTPTHFEFVSQGTALSATGKNVGRRGQSGNQGPEIIYDEYKMEQAGAIREARAIIQGNTIAILGGDTTTPLYLNMSGGSFYTSDRCFSQITGTSHAECHNESVFIMRGYAPSQDAEGNQLPSWYEGHVSQDSLYKSHLKRTWGRGEINLTNGPDLEFFDGSKFHMHGYWNNGTVKNGTVQFATNDLITNIDDIWQNDDYIQKLNELNMKIIDYSQAKYEQKEGTNNYIVSGLEYTLIKWSEHPNKNNGSPVIEFIEDAEVRCMGDTKIILTDKDRDINGIIYQAGLTFCFGEEKINFSINKLKELAN